MADDVVRLPPPMLGKSSHPLMRAATVNPERFLAWVLDTWDDGTGRAHLERMYSTDRNRAYALASMLIDDNFAPARVGERRGLTFLRDQLNRGTPRSER